MNPRPFYPVQTQSGETYVVDGRSKTVVRVVAGSFDTTERWKLAQRAAARLNSDHVSRTYAVRQRLALGCFLLLAVLLLIGLATGGLPL